MKLKYWKTLRNYLVGWFIASLLWELLRNTDLISEGLVLSTLSVRIAVFALAWLTQAFFYGLLHVLIDSYIKGKVPFIKLLITTILLQLLVTVLIVIIIFYILMVTEIIPKIHKMSSFNNFIKQSSFIIGFIYAVFINTIIILFIHINRMLGEGNLLKLMTGKFYTPQIEERIFMFLDLRSSTTHAEKLGHIKYSKLIQDCFHDIAVVHNYGAEIYQYVGDEAVLVWKTNKDANYINCIKAFYAFEDCLKKRTNHYMQNYSILPEFKAGINIGVITITEVGEVKREIAYHGDTINTAARIQGECNRLNTNLLLSEKLMQQIKLEPWLTANLKGKVQLKGKSETVPIYCIERI